MGWSVGRLRIAVPMARRPAASASSQGDGPPVSARFGPLAGGKVDVWVAVGLGLVGAVGVGVWVTHEGRGTTVPGSVARQTSRPEAKLEALIK